jgi:hypothetical protein
MEIVMTILSILTAMAAGGAVMAAQPAAAQVSTAAAEKPRVIVLTDVGSDPDDQQSLVRLLTYANDLDIESLVATTSNHMRTRTNPGMVEERIRAYGEVLPNLRVHDPAYPSAESLMQRMRTGSQAWGMAAIGKGKDTDASQMIIAAVDRPDPRPVWVIVWGGAANLGQALWSVRDTRSPEQVEEFLSKLRVYTISDQDDSGAWVRHQFPGLFWISSIHAFGDYHSAAWTGISSKVPGADPSLVSNEWLNANIRSKGPLGSAYPLPLYGVEGDTPSFLYLIPNGLGSPEHPDWGSWGGRWGKMSDAFGLWTDLGDTVQGVDGQSHTDPKATIWRWRQAFQNDFAARMDWSVSPTFAGANHRPVIKLNGVDGTMPLRIEACPGDTISLSAAGSSDPDGQPLTYRWWRYTDATGRYPVNATLDSPDAVQTTVTVGGPPRSDRVPVFPKGFSVHVILEVKDNGSPVLTSYRRAVITVPDWRVPRALGKDCPAQ